MKIIELQSSQLIPMLEKVSACGDSGLALSTMSAKRPASAKPGLLARHDSHPSGKRMGEKTERTTEAAKQRLAPVSTSRHQE